TGSASGTGARRARTAWGSRAWPALPARLRRTSARCCTRRCARSGSRWPVRLPTTGRSPAAPTGSAPPAPGLGRRCTGTCPAGTCSCLHSVRVPREVGLHRVEQIEGVDVVGLLARAGHAHHQHEVHEAVGGVARQPQAFKRDLAESLLDVAIGDPLNGLAVELGIRAVRAELPGTAELERQVPGAD